MSVLRRMGPSILRPSILRRSFVTGYKPTAELVQTSVEGVDAPTLASFSGMPTNGRTAIIYQPQKTAMQSVNDPSGWSVKFVSAEKKVNPLMGWTTGWDTFADQNRLHFSTKEGAMKWAMEQGYVIETQEPHTRRFKRKSYSDNFKWKGPAPQMKST
eukprot:gb/GEZN01019264.1/.p1 GENE.gb/GEZN01019264.1/~~gb/GEZN01019264.1/.p1  ORF type:complete len:168 (-),score=16.69 gb/GEZN01019264.1/:222-692(-)